MKVEAIVPEPAPVAYRATFSRDEATVLVMALRDAADKYTYAVGRDEWRKWADALSREMDR